MQPALMWFFLLLGGQCFHAIEGFLYYPRKCSFGYLAAVAMPLDLGPNRNVYVAFNFESNYALPSNDTYNDWINRWKLDQNFFGIGNNVTAINGRREHARYTRSTFYYTLLGYLEHFQMNGSACLQRTICEISAEQQLDRHNGLLGSLIKILFMPSTSLSETLSDLVYLHDKKSYYAFYEAEDHGRHVQNCDNYAQYCPGGLLDMISKWL